jgi:hypothetical protein
MLPERSILIMQTQNCQNCNQDFTIEKEDSNFYEKIRVPAPTWCPECRLMRRLSWRNNRSLHRRSCDLCRKSIVSIYQEGTPFPVYCRECWHGDGWDPMAFAMEIDWSKPFLVQWLELFNKVPKLALWQIGNIVNSQFTNNIYDSKDCYLSYSVVEAENIFYSENIDYGRYVMDSYLSISSELVYENQGSRQYNSKFILQSNDCMESMFLFDCVNCQSCFMSSNLRNRKYVFRNQQLTKESYDAAILEENLSSRKRLNTLREEWKNLMENAIHRYSRVVACVNTTGNFIRNAKNTRDSFQVHEVENIAYCMRGLDFKDSMDLYATAHGELIYEGVACTSGVYGIFFSINCTESSNILYSSQCQNSSDLFGAIGLKNKKYCILNKQYSKEEYEELLPKVMKHMEQMPYVDSKGRVYKYGEFLPVDFSPFGYNETVANEFFPLNEQELAQKGFNFYNHKEKSYTATIFTEQIPDSIAETSESILSEAIGCKHAPNGRTECNHLCTTAFKVTPDEFSLYKRMDIPVPELCPNCRHYERVGLFFEPPKLYPGECMCNKENHEHAGKCATTFKTPYAPGRPEKLYCETCYNKEIY